MQIEYSPLSSIKPAPRNPKNHNLDALHESFKRFGFVMPLLKNMKTGRLTAGHGRLEELQRSKELGEEPPANIRVENGEWLVPIIEGISFENDEEAEAYLLADNRLVELGGWTQAELLPILQEFSEKKKLSGTGYTQEEVAGFLEGLSKEGGAEYPDLPEDKGVFQTRTFTLHDDQAAMVDAAIEKARPLSAPSDNENSNGNALALICEEWSQADG